MVFPFASPRDTVNTRGKAIRPVKPEKLRYVLKAIGVYREIDSAVNEGKNVGGIKE
jgi:hypothetical protein